MLPGNVDPRRADKQQRYKPPPSSNNAAPGEDLTPDYMNILDSQKKSMHSSNRSDRFKVVKIESTEPFRRGRWECMDFLDQSYRRIIQQNYEAYKSSDTNVSMSNCDRLEQPRRNVSPSWGTNIDLQSSMLQIFYRQNKTIANSETHKKSSAQKHPSESPGALNGTLHSDFSYRNHVLRPGMVSSSLVGVRYPFELNFNANEDLALPNNNATTFPQQICRASNCSTDVANNFITESNQIPVESQQFIQNMTIPTFQEFNSTQQNYSTPNKNGQYIYQHGNALTVNMYQNLTSSPRQQVNSCQISNNASGIFSVPTVPTNTYNSNFEMETHCYDDSNFVTYNVSSPNFGPMGPTYQQFANMHHPSYQTQNSTRSTPVSNVSRLENPPTYENMLNKSQSQCSFNTSSINSISEENVVQGMTHVKIYHSGQQNVQITLLNNQNSGNVQVINTNMQTSNRGINDLNQGSTHRTIPPHCQRVLFPETLSAADAVLTKSFVVPIYSQSYQVPMYVPMQKIVENVAENAADSVIVPGCILIPHNIIPGVVPKQNPQLSPSQQRAIEACVYSLLGVEKVSPSGDGSEGPTTIIEKIEALMDLVTKHLKVAVLADMNELKQHIQALNERIAELERENTLLKCDCMHKNKHV